jgi:tripartite-type tricarboxylate transporter receptor subunit TctC
MPTVAEAGVPGYEATIWLGLMAPAARRGRCSRSSMPK